MPHVYGDGDRFAKPVFQSSEVSGKRTIGIGFNMDRPEALSEWEKAFGNSISFDAARSGEIKLTRDQGRTLLVFGVEQREGELEKIYGPYWKRFKPNERLATTDLYSQGRCLVGPKTRFYQNTINYSKTGKIEYLQEIDKEIRYHSNAAKLPGNIRRNNAQADIHYSRKCPLYAKRDESPIPNKKITATPGKTIIPYSFGEGRKANPHLKDYFIWRTQRDAKVRDRHMGREGVIYRTGEIEFNDFNCRCYPEPVPDNVDIKLEKFIVTPFYIEKRDSRIDARIQQLEYQIMMIKKAVNYSDYSPER